MGDENKPDIPTDGWPIESPSVIAEALRRLTENSHQHRWDILDIWKPPQNRPIHPRMAELGQGKITIVLMRCRECSLPATAELDGYWTMEQITAKINEPSD